MRQVFGLILFLVIPLGTAAVSSFYTVKAAQPEGQAEEQPEEPKQCKPWESGKPPPGNPGTPPAPRGTGSR